jgi:hypothetical protein
VAMRRLVRIDAHAADRIDDGTVIFGDRVPGVVVTSAMRRFRRRRVDVIMHGHRLLRL